MRCAERERAAKRLAALARSSEAVESAAQVPLAQLSTLSSLAARSTLSTRCSCAILTVVSRLLHFCCALAAVGTVIVHQQQWPLIQA